MKNASGCLLAACLLCACSPPRPLVSTGPTATLAPSLSSDSVGTSGKFWRVYKFNDATCTSSEKGVVFARKLTGNSGGDLAPIVLPAGNRITLGFGYMESRFAQNRECSYTVTFTPEANQHYTARFAVTGNSNACDLSLTDSTGHPAEASQPVMSCVVGLLNHKIRNGQPGVLNWKIQVDLAH